MPNMVKIFSLQGHGLFDQGCAVQSTAITSHVDVNQKKDCTSHDSSTHTGSLHI